MTWLLGAVLAYHLISEISWRKERTELINKIMSRSYHEYQFAHNVDKPMRPDGETVAGKIKAEEELAENLAPIQGFGMN